MLLLSVHDFFLGGGCTASVVNASPLRKKTNVCQFWDDLMRLTMKSAGACLSDVDQCHVLAPGTPSSWWPCCWAQGVCCHHCSRFVIPIPSRRQQSQFNGHAMAMAGLWQYAPRCWYACMWQGMVLMMWRGVGWSISESSLPYPWQ